MKHNLQNVWLIGGLVRWKDDYAEVEITRTKTAALQFAEKRLADAAVQWKVKGKWIKESFDKPGPFLESAHKRFKGNWEAFVAASLAERYHFSDSYYLRFYELLRCGITIIEPDGNIIRITTPNPKLVAEIQSRHEKSEKHWDQIVSGLCESIKNRKL